MIIPVLYFSTEEKSIFNWFALGIFVVAGLTDQLDGYIARKTGTETSTGALLDLIADKLLICILIIWLLYISKTSLLFFIPSVVIISRELVISSLRQFFAEKKGLNPIKVSFVAKSKTTIQITAIAFWLISPNFGYSFEILTLVLIWFTAFISLFSLYDYFLSYQKLIK